MSYLRSNIDRAIIVTQFDLRGFWHPLGFRQKKGESAKSFSVIPGNMISFAAGFGHEEPEDRKATDSSYINTFQGSFQQILQMCKRLASDCDLSQKEAIQLIVVDILKQSKKMKAKALRNKTKPPPYLKALKKNNWWGRTVLALMEAFEVPKQGIK